MTPQNPDSIKSAKFVNVLIEPENMENYFYQQIANSTAHRPIRDLLSSAVINNKSLLPELMAIALNTSDVNHHKACWTLELVIEARITWLEDYIDAFCKSLCVLKHEGALRSVSKIAMFAVQYNLKNPGFLSSEQAEQITESCFDWLINPKGKVATKAYAMRALYTLGQTASWIYPELSRILQEDAVKHTAAYTAAAKHILQKININKQLQNCELKRKSGK